MKPVSFLLLLVLSNSSHFFSVILFIYASAPGGSPTCAQIQTSVVASAALSSSTIFLTTAFPERHQRSRDVRQAKRSIIDQLRIFIPLRESVLLASSLRYCLLVIHVCCWCCVLAEQGFELGSQASSVGSVPRLCLPCRSRCCGWCGDDHVQQGNMMKSKSIRAAANLTEMIRLFSKNAV